MAPDGVQQWDEPGTLRMQYPKLRRLNASTLPSSCGAARACSSPTTRSVHVRSCAALVLGFSVSGPSPNFMHSKSVACMKLVRPRSLAWASASSSWATSTVWYTAMAARLPAQ